MKIFRYLAFGVVMLIIVIAIVSAFHSTSTPKPLQNATVTIVDEGAKQAGLDLQALGELIKKSPTPAKLEETLNSPGSINNLDLDKDGKVDFVKVSEEGSGNNKTLKFEDETSDGVKTEIATVRIEKTDNNNANMDISGNQAMYGDNYSYHSGFSFGEVLLMAYLFSPHTPYYSPWGYRSYPGYYRPYSPVPVASYRRTVTTYNSHPTGTLSTPATASSTRSASSPGSSGTRSLSSPASSQRSFSTRDASRPVGSGGFGSHSSSAGSSSHSTSSSTSSSSSSRSGFGSGSRSSSSSSHSSSSRSFGRRH